MNEIEIIENCEQGSEEWHQLRCGIPTASCFSDVMSGAKDGSGVSKVRDLYMRKLAGEFITREPRKDFQSAAMLKGAEVEPQLRAQFIIESGLSIRQVAFVRRTMDFGVIGASPDALIGDGCGLELKKADPHVLIEILRANKLPGEHVAQVQGSMFVSGASSWWVGIGYPGMPMLRRLIKRDTAYCARLEVGLRAFQEELDEMVRWLKNYGK